VATRLKLSDSLLNAIALFVLGVAALLRLLDFNQWSLSNDELSSVIRAQYDKFSTLIELGVRPDNHPALNQTLLYFWLKLFPDTPMMVRLPYVILSIIGLYFFYAFARKVFGSKVALPFLISLSFSFIFLLYHQIARPYALGFFVLSVLSYTWLCFINEGKKKDALLYIFFGGLSLYTHYALALSSLCLALAGFLFLYKDRSRLKLYLLANLLIALLFLPHIGISLDQFARGGLSWLSPPEGDFLLKFFEYSLNGSPLLIALIIGAPLLAIRSYRPSKKMTVRWALTFFFFIPFFVIYYYSLAVKPIIQFSLLLFSFPYLLLFFFSFLNKAKASTVLIYSTLLLLISFSSLFFPHNRVSRKPFANFEGVSKKLIEWERDPQESLTINSAIQAAYFNYYLRQMKADEPANLITIYGREGLAEAISTVYSQEPETLGIAFGNVPPPPELYEFARIHYPKLLENHRYYNSAAWLLGKEDDGQTDQDRPYTFYSTLSGSVHADRWEMKADFYQDSLNGREKEIFNIDESEEFPVTYRGKIKHAFREGSKWLTVRARLKSKTESGLALVAATSREGKSIGQRQISTDLFQQADQWYWSVLVYELPENARENDELTVYFWNPNHSKAVVDKIELVNFDDSDFDYYQWP